MDSTGTPEDVRNTDEGSFESNVSEQPSGHCVLVATSQGLFTAEQLQELKTTHIVISHDQSIDVLKAQTSSASTPPISLEAKKLKYNWDPSVHESVLPVRCRNISGDFYKNRFGSGGRGRCIKVGEEWFTPSEFESLCGRANSKDWKRSIRYAGRTINCLIEEGLLQPHATSCTCSACCDDTTIRGPVRLFTPYKRRKREDSTKMTIQQDDEKSQEGLPVKDTLVVTLPSSVSNVTESIQVVTATTGNLVDTITGSNFITEDGETMIMTPISTPQTPRTAPTALDFSEQRHWWQLEEMAKNLVRQVHELQKQVDAVRQQSLAAREASQQQLRLQLENEKKEALNTSRIEAQMNLSRAILEARAEKEIAVQQALQQVRAETKMDPTDKEIGDGKRCENCNREAFSNCTGCGRVSYCSTFCQRKDWKNHREECGNIIIMPASPDKNNA